MKNSEKLRSEAQAEENDLKALGLYTKVLREERVESFENYKDKLLAEFNITEYEAQGKITIEPTIYGAVDYYPKANKILIRKQKQEEFSIRTYDNGVLHIVIGRTYGGEGYSGMTDGVDVKGKLTEVSRLLTSDRTSIRSDYSGKKYKRKIDRLKWLVDLWVRWQKT